MGNPGLRSTPLLGTHLQTSLSTSPRGIPAAILKYVPLCEVDEGSFIWTFYMLHRSQYNTIVIIFFLTFITAQAYQYTYRMLHQTNLQGEKM